MSPMPMQSKIGDASLKFGPDWLRALSSSENPGPGGGPNPGGDGHGLGLGPPPGRGFGFSGWGNSSDGRSAGFHSSSNNKDHNNHHNYSAAAAFSSPPSSSSSSFHPQHSSSHHGGGGGFNKGTPPPGSGSSSSSTPGGGGNPLRFFKQSEVRYSREEMLALYDKNLDPPSFLLTFGTLFMDKMQPPLAFSQPSEEEIRIWHIPQPESSRQGPGGGSGGAPIGRGYASRGRGSGLDRGGRGGGRGRGSSYSSTYGARPHEEEERSPGGGFSRPRNFERSQSNHERTAWGERNGGIGSGGGGPLGAGGSGGGGLISGGPPLSAGLGDDPGNRTGGGSWRSRESFGGRRGVGEENNAEQDGWRKPRWRRGDEVGEQEQEYNRSSGGRRLLHRSWSEEENHDNIPEWARDNPSEESGTFDSSGAFHGDDRGSSKSREINLERKIEDGGGGGLKSRVESSEHSGSHSDRVQKRVQERTLPADVNKPVIPASVQEEGENPGGDDEQHLTSYRDRSRGDRRSGSGGGDPTISNNNSSSFNNTGTTNNSITSIQKQLLESSGGGGGNIQMQQQHHSSLEKQRIIQTAQLQMNAAAVMHGLQQHHGQLGDIGRLVANHQESKMGQGRGGGGGHNEDDHYRSMTEEAMNLVSKLINEEDGTGSRRLGLGGQGLGSLTQQQQQALLASIAASSGDKINAVNDLSRSSHPGGGGSGTQNMPQQNIPPSSSVSSSSTSSSHPHPPLPASPSPASFEIWFYRDPQGSTQGPFSTHEMGLWCSQGYFSGSLQLRRECDKVFITLLEMGKVYGRNPFAVSPDASPPPPIVQDPNSALDFPSPTPRGGGVVDGSRELQAQIQQQQIRQQQQQQHALLQQQNIMREQQYMLNMGSKPGDNNSWQQGQPSTATSIPPSVVPNMPQQSRSVPNNSSSNNSSALSSEQIQAQLLMSMAKSQGLDRDSNAMEQLHALFQRQLKNAAGNEALHSQIKNSYHPDMMGNSQSTPAMETKQASAVASDPIQSLVQQLTSMANTQQKLNSKPENVISPWGQQQQQQGVPVNIINNSVAQPSQPQREVVQPNNQWGAIHPTQAPWEYREQMAKLQEEEHRRRKEEEELERKRLLDEAEEQRKRLEDQARIEHERKRLEENQRIEEEKQRKIREEQYLIQKQQQELMRKQQEEAEIQRAKDLQRQTLEQQRQLRDEQTRLAEEQQKLEEIRLEKERKEQVAAERELKLRSDRERELKHHQQFSWNSTPSSVQGGIPPINNNNNNNVGGGGGGGVAPPPNKSLLEIQQEEAIKMEKEAREKKKAAAEQARLNAAAAAAAAQQQKAINLKWAQTGPAAPTKAPVIKSLTEIQAEEQAKLHKQQEHDREKRAIINHHQAQQAAWSAQLTWADRAAALAAQSGSGGGSGGSKKVNGGGVWDDNSMASKLKQHQQQQANSNNPPLSSASAAATLSSNNNNRSSGGGKRGGNSTNDESFMKLFSLQQEAGSGSAVEGGGSSSTSKGGRPNNKGQVQNIGGGGPPDDFTRWCSDRIQAIASGSVDIPTFVSFLKEVESPYEVGDYVRSYLGDGKEAKEFSREFLERRSRWKNARKEGGSGGGFEDNLCRPASAINPNSNDFQEVKAKGKKTKKGKMQKVDSRILGFSTSAATDRLNRDYGDSTD